MSQGRPRYGRACTHTRSRHGAGRGAGGAAGARGAQALGWGVRHWYWGAGALGAGARWAPGRAGRKGTRGMDAATRKLRLRHGQARPRHGHERAACAHRLGQLGARALGLVFDLVFDLVLFLSHCLDPVHEHYSSQFFLKIFL